MRRVIRLDRAPPRARHTQSAVPSAGPTSRARVGPRSAPRGQLRAAAAGARVVTVVAQQIHSWRTTTAAPGRHDNW